MKRKFQLDALDVLLNYPFLTVLMTDVSAAICNGGIGPLERMFEARPTLISSQFRPTIYRMMVPFHETVRRWKLSHLELLCSKGIALDILDDDGLTALHSALDSSWVAGIKALLDAGAEVGRKEDWKSSAWEIAARNMSAQHPRLFGNPQTDLTQGTIWHGIRWYTHWESHVTAISENRDIRAWEMVQAKMIEVGYLRPDGTEDILEPEEERTFLHPIFRQFSTNTPLEIPPKRSFCGYCGNLLTRFSNRIRYYRSHYPPQELLILAGIFVLTLCFVAFYQAAEVVVWVMEDQRYRKQRMMMCGLFLVVLWWLVKR